VSVRRDLLAFALVAVAGVAALLAFGARPVQTRAFSLDVPDVGAVATLSRGQQVCERPIIGPTAFGGLRVWLLAPSASGALDVTVSDAATGRSLALGRIVVPAGAPTGPFATGLTDTVPAHRPVRLCLLSGRPGTITLLGSAPTNPSVHLTVAGKPSTMGLATVMVAPHRHSLLASLPTAFRHASLFRSGWVGPWTFWALAAGIVMAFVLVAVAIASAAGSQESEDLPTTANGDPSA
jgi:hypothetical protein